VHGRGIPSINIIIKKGERDLSEDERSTITKEEKPKVEGRKPRRPTRPSKEFTSEMSGLVLGRSPGKRRVRRYEIF
jgi:hypothetical protein